MDVLLCFLVLNTLCKALSLCTWSVKHNFFIKPWRVLPVLIPQRPKVEHSRDKADLQECFLLFSNSQHLKCIYESLLHIVSILLNVTHSLKLYFYSTKQLLRYKQIRKMYCHLLPNYYKLGLTWNKLECRVAHHFLMIMTKREQWVRLADLKCSCGFKDAVSPLSLI